MGIRASQRPTPRGIEDCRHPMLYPRSPIPVITTSCRGCVELAHSKRLNARLEQDLRDAHKAIARLNEMILSHTGSPRASSQTSSVHGFPAPAALEHRQSCMSEPAEPPSDRLQQLESLFDAMDLDSSGFIDADEVNELALTRRSLFAQDGDRPWTDALNSHLLRKIDADANGRINQGEYTSHYLKLFQAQPEAHFMKWVDQFHHVINKRQQSREQYDPCSSTVTVTIAADTCPCSPSSVMDRANSCSGLPRKVSRAALPHSVTPKPMKRGHFMEQALEAELRQSFGSESTSPPGTLQLSEESAQRLIRTKFAVDFEVQDELQSVARARDVARARGTKFRLFFSKML